MLHRMLMQRACMPPACYASCSAAHAQEAERSICMRRRANFKTQNEYTTLLSGDIVDEIPSCRRNRHQKYQKAKKLFRRAIVSPLWRRAISARKETHAETQTLHMHRRMQSWQTQIRRRTDRSHASGSHRRTWPHRVRVCAISMRSC